MQRASADLLIREGVPEGEADVCLTDDATIQELNRTYRNEDKPTDVLSFAQEEGEDFPKLPTVEGKPRLLGDIVISVETAERQAKQHGFNLEQELALLTVHGLLHLLGYEDETVEGTAEMRAKEREYLSLSYPDM